MQKTKWVFELKKKVPQFLEKLKGKKRAGVFHYSLSGDLYGEKIKWGLGNTVFAIKIYYILNLLNTLPSSEKEMMVNFIQSFQKRDGIISDSFLRKKAFLRNILTPIKNTEVSRAETRQAISSLYLLEKKPSLPYQDFPQSKREISSYLQKLKWQKPHHAGSQFSHLLFFLKNSGLKNKEELMSTAIAWVGKLQNPQNGFWFKGKVSNQEKINGAMKIITGLKVAGRVKFKYPEKIIDLGLREKKSKDACDNFNLIYVLHYANKVAGRTYRLKEIKEFAQKKSEDYRRYYYPLLGGFSFFPRKANVYYYGARITQGLAEPDIHGTLMCLWGISIITQILEQNREWGFKELIP